MALSKGRWEETGQAAGKIETKTNSTQVGRSLEFVVNEGTGGCWDTNLYLKISQQLTRFISGSLYSN